MTFLEPKDPVRLRWLGEQVRGRRLAKAFLALDTWMLSAVAAMAVGLILALVLASGSVMTYALAVLAILGFLIRDVAIFVVTRVLAGTKGDIAALAILATLYLLLPMILAGLNLRALNVLFLPSMSSPLAMVFAWGQGVACAFWARRLISVPPMQ